MEPSEGGPVIKFTVCGASGAGKTSLTRRFAQGDFNIKENATIGVSFAVRRLCEHINEGDNDDDNDAKLQIWDTAGHPRFRSVVTSYFLACSVIFFVYDASTRDTFEAIETIWLEAAGWRQFVTTNTYGRVGSPSTMAFLIGTKSDLPLAVTEDEAREYSISRNMAGFWLVSAAKESDAGHIFKNAAMAYLDRVGTTIDQDGNKITIVYPDNAHLLDDHDEKEPHKKCCAIY